MLLKKRRVIATETENSDAVTEKGRFGVSDAGIGWKLAKNQNEEIVLLSFGIRSCGFN